MSRLPVCDVSQRRVQCRGQSLHDRASPVWLPAMEMVSFERAANGRGPLSRLLCRVIAVAYDDIRFAIDSLPSDALLCGQYNI